MPALETGVVLGANAREEGALLAPEARHAPVPPIGWNAGPVRGQPGSSRCQELSDLALDAQVIHGLAARRLEGGTDSTPNTPVFLGSAADAWIAPHMAGRGPNEGAAKTSVRRRSGPSPAPGAAWASTSPGPPSRPGMRSSRRDATQSR